MTHQPTHQTWAVGALRDPVVVLVTLGGSGFLPKAPGTWGSVVTLGLWWLLVPWLGLVSELGWLLILALATLLGVWAIAVVQRRYGVVDAGEIVIDEFAGMGIALLWLPALWWAPLLAFAVFRLFDVAKPWPVSWADRQHTPVGVMLDDLIAGLGALVVVQVAVFVFTDASRWQLL